MLAGRWADVGQQVMASLGMRAGMWPHMAKPMEILSTVLESPKGDLSNGWLSKADGPPWRTVANRQCRNGRDLWRRMRARHNSDGGMVGGSRVAGRRSVERRLGKVMAAREVRETSSSIFRRRVKRV